MFSNRQTGWMKTVFVFSGILVVFFISIHIVGVFVKPFFMDSRVFLDSFKDTETWGAVGTSLSAALFSVLIGLLFGVPTAYLLDREDFPGKKVVEGIIDLPMAIPHTVAGIALLIVLGSGGFIGEHIEPLLQFSRSFFGIVAAMTLISIPFMINSAKEGFQSVDPRMGKIARTLGASEWRIFFRVELPLATPQIFNGAIMSWARAISEFSAVVILVTFYPMIAPGLIWSRLYSEGLAQSLAVAVVLLAVILPIFVLLRQVRERLFFKY